MGVCKVVYRLDLKHLILWHKICFLKSILAAGKSLLVDCLTFMKGNEWSVVLYDDLLLDVSLSKYDFTDRLWRILTL